MQTIESGKDVILACYCSELFDDLRHCNIHRTYRRLLSKYRFTDRRTRGPVPPPPNTAVTRPGAQPTDTIHHKSHQHNSTSPETQLLSNIKQPTAPTIIPSLSSDLNFKPALSVALPGPPPSSPVFSPRTHKRAPNRARFSSSPQPGTTGLPVESYTMTIDPNSSQLRHSLCVNMNQLQPSVDNPSRRAAVGEPQHSKHSGSVKSLSPSKQKKKQDQSMTLGNKEEVKGCTGVDSITVTGEKREVKVEEHCARKMVHAKKMEGKKLRKAEKQISEMLTKMREPPSKDIRDMPSSTTTHRAPRLSKEALAFSRVFESMTLSTMRAVDRIHEVEREREDWDRKASHVTSMKMERDKRRLKIQDLRQRTKETIEAWKVTEENKLERLQDQNARLISQHLLEKFIQRSTAMESRKREAADQLLAAEFAQQALNIGRKVSKDDRKISAENRRVEIKREVEQLTEAARQRKNEARKEREIRDTQLLWEGVLAKKELNGKMMQVIYIQCRITDAHIIYR